MPQADPERVDPDLPRLGLATLVPPSGGLERLLAKRAQRGLRLDGWLPAAACAASLTLVSLVLRGPRIDVDEVRRQLGLQGTTLQIQDTQRVLERRAVARGVHIYTLRGTTAVRGPAEPSPP